jgi:hypothetical protein
LRNQRKAEWQTSPSLRAEASERPPERKRPILLGVKFAHAPEWGNREAGLDSRESQANRSHHLPRQFAGWARINPGFSVRSIIALKSPQCLIAYDLLNLSGLNDESEQKRLLIVS